MEVSGNLDRFCRLCFEQRSVSYSLFDGRTAEMLESLTSMKVSCGNTFYCVICADCFIKLKKTYKYQQKLIANERMFSVQATVKNEEIVENLSIKSEEEEENISASDHTYASSIGVATDILAIDMTEKKTPLIMEELDIIPVNYSCDKCCKTFQKGNDFMCHLDTHRTRFCKICLKEIHLDEFMQHAKSHASGKCDYCGLICKNKPALKYHVFKEHVDSKTMCEICGTISDNEMRHNLHMARIHRGEASFMCDICGIKLFTSASLRKHRMVKHVKEKRFFCNICNKAFVREYALQSHMITHSDVVLFVCEVCGKGFKLRHNLRMHQENIHDLHVEGSYECVVCKKTFLTYLALGIHTRVHTK